MNARVRFLAALTLLAAALHSTVGPLGAQSAAAVALGGTVSSAAEGAMSGVLVSAKLNGSTLTTTVVTDASGKYTFPRARLQAGTYAIGIRAIGYDLEAPVSATVRASGPATVDLRLQKTSDLASQLSNAEWLSSMPGTDGQKAEIRGCAHCHMLNLITRSHHDAQQFVRVVERMAGYPPLSFPLMVQRTPAPRIGGGEVSRERRLQTWTRQAEYLATLNLRREFRAWISTEDSAPAFRRCHPGHLHGVRPAETHPPAPRRDRRFDRHGVVRELRRAESRRPEGRDRAAA